ncbi:MAG: hypothetical protein RL094_95 [Candidatus Parcubacteria bacterium]|jgi:cob(I)alamin adenosyltransferase
MLYTRKGDGGTTKTFGCTQRMSKGSPVAEALGSLDEVNSFLGVVKVASAKSGFKVDLAGGQRAFEAVVHNIQETLFIIQAEVAGFPKPLPDGKVAQTEEIIDTIEKMLPPIKTFFISGGSELAALFDVSRTMARRAERRVVGLNDDIKAGVAGPQATPISEPALAYLNRLSSLLYAMARLSNHLAGVVETPPSYQ